MTKHRGRFLLTGLLNTYGIAGAYLDILFFFLGGGGAVVFFPTEIPQFSLLKIRVRK